MSEFERTDGERLAVMETLLNGLTTSMARLESTVTVQITKLEKRIESLEDFEYTHETAGTKNARRMGYDVIMYIIIAGLGAAIGYLASLR